MSTFQDGYKFFAKNAGAMGASIQGGDYIQSIEQEISKLTQKMNAELSGSHATVDTAKGFAAEHWHAGTFNVSSALHGSTNRARVAEDIRGQLGSPDIVGDAGPAGLKYYKTAEGSAGQQAKSLWERYKEYEAQAKTAGRSPMSFDEYSQKAPEMGMNASLYGGQARIIPKEQLEQAKKFLERKIAKESATRPEQVERYKETLALLQDRLKDSKGNESVSLSSEDATKIARLAEDGKFAPKEFGISTEALINWDYIRAQSLQAGLSAAAITVALKTAPEIIKGIRHLIETGEVDPEQLKKIGLSALSGSAEGFLRGMVSASITIACKAGLFGGALKSVSPTMVGGIVVFALDSVKGSILVLAGKKEGQEFKQEIAEEAFSTVGAAVAGATLNTIIPGVGYLVGALIGSMLGSYSYHIVTKTTTADQIVSYFRQQAKLYEQYAAKLFQIDLEAFQKITTIYTEVIEKICSAKNESELNHMLRKAYEILDLGFPWHGDFDTFMQGDNHLVFE